VLICSLGVGGLGGGGGGFWGGGFGVFWVVGGGRVGWGVGAQRKETPLKDSSCVIRRCVGYQRRGG